MNEMLLPIMRLRSRFLRFDLSINLTRLARGRCPHRRRAPMGFTLMLGQSILMGPLGGTYALDHFLNELSPVLADAQTKLAEFHRLAMSQTTAVAAERQHLLSRTLIGRFMKNCGHEFLVRYIQVVGQITACVLLTTFLAKLLGFTTTNVQGALLGGATVVVHAILLVMIGILITLSGLSLDQWFDSCFLMSFVAGVSATVSSMVVGLSPISLLSGMVFCGVELCTILIESWHQKGGAYL